MEPSFIAIPLEQVPTKSKCSISRKQPRAFSQLGEGTFASKYLLLILPCADFDLAQARRIAGRKGIGYQTFLEMLPDRTGEAELEEGNGRNGLLTWSDDQVIVNP